ncbi:hypothetical protein [Nocardia sp. NBC_00511]|uniref:hypothetical protein n=1 Tax=Nocardia sp. NBC_00511 TaxID=2903591 RepID=UPI0030E198A7
MITQRRWTALIPAGYSLALALLVTGPLLGPGYLLLRDAVSTPRSYLTDSALGLGDAAPRAVPQDALIAALSTVIDGGILVKTILLLAIWLAGWGAATLTRHLLHVGLGPRLVAATVTIWNPYVAERLLQGHWSLLTGYAALPWTALLATRLRARSAERAAITPAQGANSQRDTETPLHESNSPTANTTDRVDPAAATAPAEGTGSRADVEIPPGVDEPVVDNSGTVGRAHPPASADRRGTHWRAVGSWAALAGCFAAAGLTPTGSLLAGCVAAVLVGRRNLLGAAGLWVLSAAPWLIATALSGAGSEPSDPAGVAAFAARAEPWLGTLGSLAGLGGLWNSTAVPDSRTTFFAAIGTLLLLSVVATGVRGVLGGRDGKAHPLRTSSSENLGGTAAQADGSGSGDGAVESTARTALFEQVRWTARRRLLGLAVVAVVVPALGATGWGLSVGEFLMTRVPGFGLVRDTQKFVALAVPAYALCAAAGCVAVTRWVAKRSESASGSAGQVRIAWVAAVFMVLTVVALPDLAWGVGGEMRAVRYPAGWERVAEMVDAPGDVAVLPGGMFRKFRYSGSAPVLDPAPRTLKRDVLQTGELPVRGGVVSGEGARAREVEQLLLHGGSAAALARSGVGWVLVEGRTPGPLGESKTTLAQLDSVYSDGDLQLYRVPGTIVAHDATAASRRVSGTAHLVWAVLLVGGFATAAGVSGSRRPRSVPGEAGGEARPDHENTD